MRLLFALMVYGFFGLSSCQTRNSESETMGLGHNQKPDISGIDIIPRSQYPKIDTLLGEEYAENEYEYAALIASELATSISNRDKQGLSRRDAHPKTHGCVTAKFHIARDINPALRHGVFIPGKEWNAWVRFSNGDSNYKKPDIEGDARGMAIKLTGVDLPGDRLLEVESDAKTQDFVLISSRRFIINEPKSYYKLIKAAGDNNRLKVLMALGFRGAPVAAKLTSLQIPNPLQTEYASSVPYQLGTGVDRKSVKYVAIPCSDHRDPLPENPSENYLRAALHASLQKGPGCFNFYVQVNNGKLSVEDSITEWKERDAPLQKIATLTIEARQDFDNRERDSFCENLSFNPWHSLADHRPLGSTNRLRKVIYEYISRVRHDRNKVPRAEPQN